MNNIITQLKFIVSIMVACLSLPLWAQSYPFSVIYSFNPTDPVGGVPNGMIVAGDRIYGVNENAALYSVKTDGTGMVVLHTFTASEGLLKLARPYLVGNTLYGTAAAGGLGAGTVWRVDTDGQNFAVLHTFSLVPNTNPPTNSDGALAFGGVVVDGGKIYGTTASGGSFGAGTIYSLNTDGSGFTVLHNFVSGGQRDSSARLVVAGGKLYGTARYEGASSRGAIFSINTDGSNYTLMHSFGFDANGYFPVAGLTLAGTTLYGVTGIGAGVYGTIFKIEIDGSGFGIVHAFTGYPTGGRSALTEVAVVGDMIYGVTFGGGAEDKGTVYAVKTDGTNFTLLHSFTAAGFDGYNPYSTPTISGTTLYGTARTTGIPGVSGTIYKIELSDCEPGTLTIQTYVGLTITGTVGCDYTIEYTTSLNEPVTWTVLTTGTLTTSPYLFIDTSPLAGSRFYRAVFH